MLGFGFQVLAGVGFMLGFGFQAWLLGLKPMGFGFRPPPVKPLKGANNHELGVSPTTGSAASRGGFRVRVRVYFILYG
jgi:hypothetical protein